MSDLSGGSDEAFLALYQFFLSDGTLGDALQRVAELARGFSAADMAGITMLVEGKPLTGVFTDPEAPEIDEAQYSTGQGPCLEAFRTRQVLRIDSTASDERWPSFAASAAAHGIGSTLSIPILARGEGLGALNLYTRKPYAFDDDATRRMERFAAHAAFVLVNAQVYWDTRQLTENLHQAMRSRATIDYAIGILMANSGRSPEDAFQVLVRASQRENRKLRDIAAEIVERAVQRSGTEHEDGRAAPPAP